MLDADWYASDRATAPARVEMLSTESRVLSVVLTPFLAAGETVQSSPAVSVKLAQWRKPTVLYPTALDGAAAYASGTKTVTQRVDARYLPRATPVAMIVSFYVMMSGGVVDLRSVVLVIVVPV